MVPQDDFRAGKNGAVTVNSTGFLYDDLVKLDMSRLLAPGWHKMTVLAKTGNTEHKGVQTGALLCFIFCPPSFAVNALLLLRVCCCAAVEAFRPL